MIKKINYILIFCCLVVAYLIVGVVQAVPTLQGKYEPWGKTEYHRLLKKHGLHQKIAILEMEWDRKTYFTRNGKRYLFQ